MDDLMQIADECFDPYSEWRIDLKEFAKIVAKKAVEAEREACVRAADDQWVKDPHISGGDAIRKRR